MSIMIHIAGISVHVDGHLRQRCAWCGTGLIDVHLERIAVQLHPGDICANCGVRRDRHRAEGHEFVDRPAYPTWADGSFVGVDGGMQYAIEPTPERLGELTEPCCMTEHPELSE